jgi:hypothetical protein
MQKWHDRMHLILLLDGKINGLAGYFHTVVESSVPDLGQPSVVSGSGSILMTRNKEKRNNSMFCRCKKADSSLLNMKYKTFSPKKYK